MHDPKIFRLSVRTRHSAATYADAVTSDQSDVSVFQTADSEVICDTQKCRHRAVDREFLMVGLDAAGKTTIPFELELVEAVTKVPTSSDSNDRDRVEDARSSDSINPATSLGRDVWLPLVCLGTRQYNDTSHTKQCARHLLQGRHVDTANGYSHQKDNLTGVHLTARWRRR